MSPLSKTWVRLRTWTSAHRIIKMSGSSSLRSQLLLNQSTIYRAEGIFIIYKFFNQGMLYFPVSSLWWYPRVTVQVMYLDYPVSWHNWFMWLGWLLMPFMCTMYLCLCWTSSRQVDITSIESMAHLQSTAVCCQAIVLVLFLALSNVSRPTFTRLWSKWC